MLIVTGTLLVLLTWALTFLLVVSLGLPLGLLTRSGSVDWGDLRRGAWWGLLVLVIALYLINLWLPLSSPAAGGILIGMGIAGAVISLWRARVLGCSGHLRWSRSGVAVIVAAVSAAVYFAVAALGPVTNYDSGLYHLGAIRYAADYAAIPGLANLYFPFGYGNAGFPLAALFENGPWSTDGFRLLNGFLILLLLADLAIRSLQRRRAGFYVLLVGALVVLVPMVALADYWVTSPSQDSAVFALTVAATALLASAVSRRRHWVAEAAAGSAVVITLALLRPTMAAYAALYLAVLLAVRWRRPSNHAPGSAATALVVGGGLLAAGAATARDYVLSGWLQYPLSALPFDVPWRAPDPVAFRLATLGYHRDPEDLWNAAQGWSWVDAWAGALPRQWEFFLVLALAAGTVVLIVLARWWHLRLRWRAMVAIMAPSLVMTALWWAFTPPSFRFAWGPVFTCFTIPIGWILWRLASGERLGRPVPWGGMAVMTFSALTIGVVLVSAVFRLDWDSEREARNWSAGITMLYEVVPVTQLAVVSRTLESGLIVQLPEEGEQCWEVFPLCVPRVSDDLRLLGTTVQEGFQDGS